MHRQGPTVVGARWPKLLLNDQKIDLRGCQGRSAQNLRIVGPNLNFR